MATPIVVPGLGESVTEATVAKWLKRPGDAVAADDPLVELETDKVTLEVNAPAAGTLQSIAAEEGATVEVGALTSGEWTLQVVATDIGGSSSTMQIPITIDRSAPSASAIPRTWRRRGRS